MSHKRSHTLQRLIKRPRCIGLNCTGSGRMNNGEKLSGQISVIFTLVTIEVVSMSHTVPMKDCMRIALC